jgi:predicted nucleotidyltransferase component of viral defense system
VVYLVRLTPGYVALHAPAQSAQGREAALIDIAQDLLLRDLGEQGVVDLVTFKGGTALRKVYAGADGRFSTDLDFGIANPDDDFTTVSTLIENAINGRRLGPFQYGIEHRRGRAHIT